MMNREDKAADIFSKDYNCSQAVFAAFSDLTDLSEEQCLKTASAFGAGIARAQKTCGAVTGALMVLGAVTFTSEDVLASKGQAYQLGQAFMESFAAEAGSVNCCDILGCTLQEAGEKGLFNTTCVDAVRLAARILTEMLG